jgi:hypothetical protein
MVGCSGYHGGIEATLQHQLSLARANPIWRGMHPITHCMILTETEPSTSNTLWWCLLSNLPIKTAFTNTRAQPPKGQNKTPREAGASDPESCESFAVIEEKDDGRDINFEIACDIAAEMDDAARDNDFKEIVMAGDCPFFEPGLIYLEAGHTCKTDDEKQNRCKMTLNRCFKHHISRPDVVVFFHTAYRLSPQVMVDTIKRTSSKQIWIVQYNLEEGENDGVTIVRNGTGYDISLAWIRCCVRANDQPWIRDQTVLTVGSDVLEASVVHQYQNVSWVRVSLRERAVPPPVVKFKKTAFDFSDDDEDTGPPPTERDRYIKMAHGNVASHNVVPRKSATRGRQATAAIAASELATIQKEQGEEDAKRQLVRDEISDQADEKKTDEIHWKAKNGGYVVVNPLALVDGYTARNYTYTFEGTTIKIVGTTAFATNKVNVAGNYLIWDGAGQMRNVSDDCVFGWTDYVGTPLWTDNHVVMKQLRMCSEDRVRFIMEANIYRWFGKAGVAEVEFRTAVRGHYNRFFKACDSLDHAITNLIKTQWWYDLVDAYNVVGVDHWKSTSRQYLHYLASRRGFESRRVDDLITRSIRCEKIKYWCNPLNIIQVISGCDLAPDFENRAVNRIFDKLVPTNEPQLIPCTYIRRQRVRVDEHKELPDISDTYRIRYEPNNEVYERPGEYVDYYGMTFDLPAALPALTSESLYRGIRERMSTPDTSDPVYVAEYVDYAKKLIDQMPEIHLPAFTREEVEQHLIDTYGEKRARATYIPELDNEMTDKDFEHTLVAKNEIYLGKTKETLKPRVIWSCKPIVIAKLGIYWKYASKEMAKFYANHTNILYVTGQTPDEVGQYAQVAQAKTNHQSANDSTSWDGTVRKHQMDVEEYRERTKIFGWPPEQEIVWRNERKVVAKTRDRAVQLTCEDTRKSGHLKTSCGNTEMNITETMYYYGYKWEDEWYGMFLGDDNYLFHVEEPDRALVERRAKGLGRTLKSEPVDNIDDGEFCSGYFWNVNGSYRWGNKPFKVLNKLGVNYNRHHPKEFQGLLYGTALGMLPTAGHVPILGAILRGLANSAEANGVRALYDGRGDNPYKIRGGVCVMPSLETYQQFADKYGTSVDLVVAYDRWLFDNVRIQDCPYLVKDDFLRAFSIMELAISDPSSDPFLHVEMTREYILNEAPVLEEMHKLIGAESIADAIRAGYDMGSEEDEMYGTNNHKFLHSLFSGVSYINFDWGVALHRMYNAHALSCGQPVCTQRKKKKNAKNKKQQPKQRSLARRVMRGGGEAVGLVLGGRRGGEIGRYLGDTAADIFGAGAYVLHQNSLMKNGVPNFASLDKTMRIAKREYLGQFAGTTTFTATAFSINPGLGSFAPWLSMIARNFTEYKLHGCVMVLVSTSANALNSTNTALGSVMLATEYNVEAPAPTHKIQMENMLGAVSGRPSENLIMGVECKSDMTPYKTHFIRSGSIPADDDLRLYDWGTIYLATTGMQAASELGEVWISYDIEFLMPRISSNPYEGMFAAAKYTSYTDLLPFNGTAGTIYGGLPVTTSTTGLKLDKSITSGSYLVVVTFQSAVPTVLDLNNPTLGNCTAISYGGFTRGWTPLDGETASLATWTQVILVTGYNANGTTIGMSNNTLPASGAFVYWTVVAIPEQDTDYL